jgi:hypothetical protein
MLYHDYVWSFTWLHLVFHLSRIAVCNQYEPGLCLCAIQMDIHPFYWHFIMLRCFGHVFQQTSVQNMASRRHYYPLWFDVLLVIWLCIHDLWSMMTPITYMWQPNGLARLPFLWFTISQRLYDFTSEMLPRLQLCSSTLILRYSTALAFYLCPLFLRELGLFIHAPLFSERCCPSFSRAETGYALLSRNTLRQQHICCGICMTSKFLCLPSKWNSTTHAVSCLPFAERQKQS